VCVMRCDCGVMMFLCLCGMIDIMSCSVFWAWVGGRARCCNMSDSTSPTRSMVWAVIHYPEGIQ